MEQQKKHRIGSFAIIVLVFLALICDLLGLIPFVKDFLGTIFWFCASIYFWKIGMGLFNGRKLAAMAISWVSGLIPIIQEIPLELVAGIVAIIIITRIEEKTGMSITSKSAIGKLPRQQTLQSASSVPLNNNGYREPVSNQIPLNQEGFRLPNGGLK